VPDVIDLNQLDTHGGQAEGGQVNGARRVNDEELDRDPAFAGTGFSIHRAFDTPSTGALSK